MAKRLCPEIVAARQSGAKRYFTGVPCSKGHVAERTTNNATCVECAKLAPSNQRDRQRKILAAWKAANPERVTLIRSRRRKAARLAAVSWADRDKMATFYKLAASLTEKTGVPHEVDHIDPLVHPLVCGLHNEFNLRVIPASENRRKSNRFTPGPPNDG